MSLPKFIAAVEVDQRQAIIHAADKLKEILGGSWTIEETRDTVIKILKTLNGSQQKLVRLIMPVSGQLWLAGDDEGVLRQALWELRKEVVEKFDLPTTFTVVPVNGDFDAARTLLEKLVREAKDAKCKEDGRPSLPQLASCLIEPHKAANHWYPKWANQEQHRRRALVANSSYFRFKRGQDTLGEFLSGFADAEKYDRPIQFADLVASTADSYIALIKADADGMGRVNSQLKWTDLAGSLPWNPAQWQELAKRTGWDPGDVASRNSWFPEEAMTLHCWAVEDCQRKALTEAVNRATKSHRSRGGTGKSARRRFPVAPIIAAGEDTWILCRRDLALQLAYDLGTGFAQAVKHNGVLDLALDKSGLKGKEAVTLSLGILFTKQGYPFEIMAELAEGLLKNAKRRRAKGTKDKQDGQNPDLQLQGYVDYYWLDSTGREDIVEARDKNLVCRDGPKKYRLYTRPWRLSEMATILDAVAKLKEEPIPRSKWEQLQIALRLGEGLSDLAYRQWYQRLDDSQRETLAGAVKLLADRLKPSDIAKDPWRLENEYLTTVLLELAELIEITTIPETAEHHG